MSIPQTRRSASELGRPKYNTGKACKSGHYADRYTQSGTCVACCRGVADVSRYGSVEAKEEVMQQNQAKRDSINELIETKIRCYPGDLSMLKQLAEALTRGRFPNLERHDIIPNKPPSDHAGGTAMHRFRLHPDDIEQVRKTSTVLLNARGPDIAAITAQQLQHTLAEVNKQADQDWPEFKP